MKLVRYGESGFEKPGVIDTQGHVRDLFHYLTDIDPKTLADPLLLAQLNAININYLPCVDDGVRLGPVVGNPGKIIHVGFNSKSHTEELGFEVLEKKEMLIFMKPSACACGANDPIIYTRCMKKLDWEAELAVVIGRQGKYIAKDQAHEYIFGYTCMNDLSERYLQFETQDSQFTKGKCFDHAAPIGPYLVTRDDIADSSVLDIKLWVNGLLRQDFNTCDYINNDAEVISYVSHYFTLYPGDVISLGSAPGNAKFWGDDQFLKPGDSVRLMITALGEQNQQVIAED
jgi:2-keto-4-pentenoate hydratase/2-oxohepta-3-ene-1,7-dioic acid hydratase in catechol pathway